MSANLENSAVATGLEKVSFHSNPKEEQCQIMFKLPYNCAHFHMLAMLCSKSFKARLQQYVNRELPDVQAGFIKGRGTWDQIANIPLDHRKARELQKNICFIDYAKAFDCVDHNKLCKIVNRLEYQTILPTSWETCMQVKKQQNWTWNNGLVPNWERSLSRLYIVTLLI